MADQEFNERNPFGFHPVGSHESAADYSSAVTVTIPTGADRFMIQTITQNVRFTLDGTTPTTTKGFRVTAGRDPIIFPLANETSLKIIEEAATAVVELQFGF